MGRNLTATESHSLTTHSSPKRCRMNSGRSRFPCGELGLETQTYSHSTMFYTHGAISIKRARERLPAC